MSRRLPDTTARHAPENLAILLREPFMALHDEIQRRFAQEGHGAVRVAHGNVMQFLDDDGTRVSVLAERAQMTKQSMAELVAHLEAHGYVERVADPADGRAKLVRATPRGRELYAIAHAVGDAALARWERALGAAKMRRLYALLGELNAVVASEQEP
jgi:DNA-binding MarR family transcriptional regulator